MKRILASLLALFLFAAPSFAHSYPELARLMQASSVQLQDKDGAGFCSGWTIDRARDYVITAEHCVSSEWGTEGGIQVDGSVVAVVFADAESDVAVLQVPGLDRPEIKPELNKKLEVGHDAAAFGYAYGFPKALFRVGKVSAIDYVIPELLPSKWVVLDVTTIGGMSGGPVVNSSGKAISMVQMGNHDIAIGRSIKELWAKTRGFWKQ